MWAGRQKFHAFSHSLLCFVQLKQQQTHIKKPYNIYTIIFFFWENTLETLTKHLLNLKMKHLLILKRNFVLLCYHSNWIWMRIIVLFTCGRNAVGWGIPLSRQNTFLHTFRTHTHTLRTPECIAKTTTTSTCKKQTKTNKTNANRSQNYKTKTNYIIKYLYTGILRGGRMSPSRLPWGLYARFGICFGQQDISYMGSEFQSD